MNLSILLTQRPVRWGLRGDPYLWQEMEKRFQEVEWPENRHTFEELLHRTYAECVGVPLDSEKDVFVKRFAHGGMSSGYVSGCFWAETAIPLLLERFMAFQSTGVDLLELRTGEPRPFFTTHICIYSCMTS